MSDNDPSLPSALTALGWSGFFDAQWGAQERALVPLRIATVHRARMSAIGTSGAVEPTLPPGLKTPQFAVGDWVLAEPDGALITRRLERHALLQRKTDGSDRPQLIAANVDTLFIVTSCNEDFNTARLERYVALANEAGTQPVIVLTKADKIDDAAPYETQARAVQRDLAVVSLNAKATRAADVLAQWCGVGKTVALVGSSGVGKSTLSNTLTQSRAQATGSIREDDAKGRHTTTSRALHPMAGGGWVIDTPGIRTLHISALTGGLETLFAEITELAPTCRFRDCTHAHEPGCAVQAAVAAGAIEVGRLERWRKLTQENDANTPQRTGPRGNKTPARGKRR